MTKEDIINAGIEYTMANNPMCIGGDAFYEMARQMNRNRSFEAGAEWVLSQLKNIDEEKLDELAGDYGWKNGESLSECTKIDKAYKAGYRRHFMESTK